MQYRITPTPLEIFFDFFSPNISMVDCVTKGKTMIVVPSSTKPISMIYGSGAHISIKEITIQPRQTLLYFDTNASCLAYSMLHSSVQ